MADARGPAPDVEHALTLPEELVLLAYDDEKGHTWNSSLDTGLGGAVMLDLSLRGRVEVREKDLVVVDPAPTGEPVLDAALLVAGLATAPHPGPGLVAAELARVLGQLPELRPGADLRGPVLRVARRLADAPTPEEARAWAGVLPAATPWPAARRAAAPRARRTVLRAADRAAGGAGLVRHKVRRAAAVLGARRR